MTPLERQMLNALRANAAVLSGEAMSKSNLITALEMTRDAIRRAVATYPSEFPLTTPERSHEPHHTSTDASA